MMRRMRRVLAALVAGAMIVFTGTSAVAADVGNRTIVERNMNFRTGPGTNYRVLGAVPGGTEVEIMGFSDDWTKVRYNGQVGWIHSGNIATVSGSQTSTSNTGSTQTTQAAASGQLTPLVDLNLRSGPGTSYMILGVVPKGTKVTVLESSGTWGRISYNGQSGWISKNFFAENQTQSQQVVTVEPEIVIFPTASSAGETWTVKVTDGYLALRSAKAFKYENEIGKLYTGTTVRVTEKPAGDYWIVYAPSLGKGGYVNKNYLVKGTADNSSTTTTTVAATMTVKVNDGYLALRSAKAFKYENEIGKLNTGDKVQVLSKDEGTYWYVYAPKLGKKGYVNKNYLV